MTNRCKLLLACLIVTILGAHVAYLVDIPAGLYLDEASIGYNAVLIGQVGIDEHHVTFPVYFKAFGEYKNPIYIYAAALIIRLFGISEFHLRMTSVLFFILALVLNSVLVAKLFPRNNLVLVYAVASLGFLPVVFVFSRISFEVISQLTWMTSINLLIWVVFEHNVNDESAISRRNKTMACLALGLILGTSIYTYSTARLLSFSSLLLIWILYLKHDSLNRLAYTTLAFLVALIPYINFTLKNPGLVTRRFEEISYLDNPISPFEKGQLFIHYLSEYWSLKFLLFHGDANLRHSTGRGGVVYLGVFILFMVGLVFVVITRSRRRFSVYLLLSLALSPLAASLTFEGTPHAIRSFLMGYYILLVSCYGLNGILEYSDNRLKTTALLSISTLLLVEITSFLLHYYLVYPTTSASAMGSYGMTDALRFAIDQNPKQIIWLKDSSVSYANLRFSEFVATKPKKPIPMYISKHATPTPSPGDCIIFNANQEASLDRFTDQYQEFRIQSPLAPIQRLLRKPVTEGIINSRCYVNLPR